MPENSENLGYSEELDDIIGTVPHWLIRGGISVFFGVLLAILGFSYFLSFPETVDTTLVLEYEHSPEPIMARQYGRLARLSVIDKQEVDENTLLGIIESSADYEDIINLRGNLDSLKRLLVADEYEKIYHFRIAQSSRYGEVQLAYDNFLTSYQQFLDYLPTGKFENKAGQIDVELANFKKKLSHLAKSKINHERNFEIASLQYQAFERLGEQKAISKMELKREESRLLDKKAPLLSVESEISQTVAAEKMKRLEYEELLSMANEQKFAITSKLNLLQNEIMEWQKKYLLISEASGKVIFHKLLKEGDWVEQSKPLMFILNRKENRLYGRLPLPQQSLGKVREGQTVLIKLDAFPYKEYGSLTGRISYISDMTNGDTALAKVELNNKTSSGQFISIKSGHTGRAQVITNTKTVLSWIFQQANVK